MSSVLQADKTDGLRSINALCTQLHLVLIKLQGGQWRSRTPYGL